MINLPKTYCITLRETLNRKLESEKYFKQVGLNVEYFYGIDGQSFGLKSTISNDEKNDGKDLFITTGAIGCFLSHLTLWNVLLHQPDDEFLILEDDIVLCNDFFNKFQKFKSELPPDWEFAYVGWLKPTGKYDKNEIINVSENVITGITPYCTHAYLVKKSALQTLIETNQLVWKSIDIQIIERSLPRLKYYMSKIPLITQKSVFNITDKVWYSRCYDWNLNPDSLLTKKTNTVQFGSGWHQVEKNKDGYMIWSNGTGEILLNDSWEKMSFEFIADGNIKNKLKIICDSVENDYEIKQGVQNIEFPINEAKSVIISSDTFRPMDLYKTSDCRNLGIRILNGITVTDKTGKSAFISLYSIYNTKTINEDDKIDGVKITKPKYGNKNGKFNIYGQISYNHHRSGWEYVLHLLEDYHNDCAPLFIGWLEKSFSWEKDRNTELKIIPYTQPWVGVFHNPPNTPNFFTETATPYCMIQSKEFQDSLSYCKGLYVLSDYHKDFLKCFIKNIPVETLYLPTETPKVKFDFDEFTQNNNKKVINIGWWCRKMSSIYQLNVDQNTYQKIRLLPSTMRVPSYMVDKVMDIEAGFRKHKLSDVELKSVIDVRHMENKEYDELLSKNVVFLDMYDASANNVVIECLIRGTPLLINPLPSVVEYLGKSYPFYFNTLEEASQKLNNMELIKFTHEYLINSGESRKVTGEYFLDRIKNGEIWKSI